jgi:biotin operon repressor
MRKPKDRWQQPQQQQHEQQGDKPKKLYGVFLVKRGLAYAGITLYENKNLVALVVLNVLGDYMDQDGNCRPAQDSIAAQIGISRQAVNRHISTLVKLEILDVVESKEGRATKYRLNPELALPDERPYQYRIEERRAAKKVKEGQPHAPEQAPTHPATELPPLEERLLIDAKVWHEEHGNGSVDEWDGGDHVNVSFYDAGFAGCRIRVPVNSLEIGRWYRDKSGAVPEFVPKSTRIFQFEDLTQQRSA